jgi:hypothetical protein
MLGLSLLAGIGYTLDALALPVRINLPSDPQQIRQPLATQLSTGAFKASVTTLPEPANHAPITSPAPSETPTISAPSLKPSGPPAREYIYSALPYTQPLETVSPTGASPWHLATIGNPSQTNPVAGSGPIVAVIDTGFALSHASLSGHWWRNSGEIGPTSSEGPLPNCTSRGLALNKSCNNLDNDGNGYPSDWQGWDFSGDDNTPQAGSVSPNGSSVSHGTFVAGLISATVTSTVGGVDQTARIMPLQALSDVGDGTTSSVSEAVIYAADHGATIINLSLGTDVDDEYMHQAITYAISKGSVIVAASGNDGCDCLLFPANYPEVVAVGATDSQDNLASFSSYGANLDLTAPGQSLCSISWTNANPTTSTACGGSGTSFAAPIVSGALSRLVAAGGKASLISQYIGITTDKTSGMGGAWRTNMFGTGRLKLSTAIVALSQAYNLSLDDAIVRFACSGTNICSITTRDANGNTAQISSKHPIGEASSLYWSTGSNISSPLVWSVLNMNNNSTFYYAISN